MDNLKAYKTPVLKQMIAMPLKPVGAWVTIWEFREQLNEWDFCNLYNLYDLLTMAKQAKVSLDVMIAMTGRDIVGAFAPKGTRS